MLRYCDNSLNLCGASTSIGVDGAKKKTKEILVQMVIRVGNDSLLILSGSVSAKQDIRRFMKEHRGRSA